MVDAPSGSLHAEPSTRALDSTLPHPKLLEDVDNQTLALRHRLVQVLHGPTAYEHPRYMEYATNGAADALRDVLLYEYGWAEEVERTRAIHPLQSMSSALSGLIDLPDDQLRARLEACRATIAAIRRERGDDLGVLELKEYIPRYS